MIRYILKLFFLLNLIFILSWFLGREILPLRETFLGRTVGELVDQPLIWSRANFDGVHYAKIACSGYGYLQEAFFPLYPKVIKFFHPLFRSFVLSGVVVSLVFFFLSLVLLTKILEEEGEKKRVIKKTLLFLVLFPTSFFFISVYTESLFLFLILLSFLLAKKKKWLWAGLIAGLASYTKLIGIFMLPALLHEYYSGESKRRMKERFLALRGNISSRMSFKYLAYLLKSRAGHIKNTIFIFFSSWGLFTYMGFLWETVRDPLYFIKVQPGFGAGRNINKVIMLYQVFWRYLKMIFTINVGEDPMYFTIWIELLIALLFLALLTVAWLKYKKLKLRVSWLIFSSLAYLLPTLTGTFSSMPRYVLVCFPCFLLLAKLKPSRYFYWLSGGLLLICSFLFVRGYWIA